MHPAENIRGSKSNKLKGRKIVLGVTGSIAAVETVKLCRELIRNGAEVHVVMSKDAQTIIHPWALEFATGKPVTIEIDGRVQHVAFCGDVPDKADLLLIAPATANTISKIACGIDDTSVTTFATTALGSKIPMIVVPAMHGTMLAHSILQKNIERLRSIGVLVLTPKTDESKAKMPSIDYIVSSVISAVGKRDLVGKRVLVIAGSTEEPIDDIRVVTNRSSGETGIELARAAYERGANVDLWMGRCDVEIPDYLKTTRFSSFSNLATMSKKIRHDVVLFPAAVSDYSPKKVRGKISSDKESITLVLRRNPKLIGDMKARLLVGFKAQAGVKDEELVRQSLQLLERSRCSLVVANSVEHVKRGWTRVILVDKNGTVERLEGTKYEIADRILDSVARMM